ncbi:hypothetical protein [Caballeronia zhejiangensis]|uniref:Tail fiber protein n=1 Tax=Caballeronia zhejiangensis TaxID=871203 RepID=A0A656QE93_9BURK|nr:hypothetical protein [Caballeronia zhejiangensis]KDR25420.1 hypothetical protein BG60_28185 [Caballeronia zhejiangensis]
MFRIDDPTAATSLPTPEAAGTEGFFTEGNPTAGTPATNVRGSWLNMIQEELRAVVVAAGLTPSKTTYTQLRDAIKSMYGPGRLLNVQVFTASGTYTPTPGTNSIVVEGVGAGGGGGGAAAAGTGLVSMAGSGGGGTYGKARFTSGFAGTAVTIGAAGSGGAAGANVGGTGGTTSFGTQLVMPGGGGGGAGSPQTAPYIIQGYTSTIAVTGANISLLAGGWSGVGIAVASNGARSGVGGDSFLGRGATGVPGGAGQAPSGSAGYGGGGSGGVSLAGGTNYAGGNGSPGVLIIWEYA